MIVSREIAYDHALDLSQVGYLIKKHRLKIPTFGLVSAMPPIGVGTSRYASALETGEAKLWVLLVGVNYYEDENLPNLRYSAIDCQGLGEALSAATQAFPRREVLVHHDFSAQISNLTTVQESLEHIVAAAKSQDTVLFYFSGHGLLEPCSQQTVLCLTDTYKDDLLNTGLKLHTLLGKLSQCAAHSQLVWLDACHSGNMTLSGARGRTQDEPVFNPTVQLLELLRQRAAQSKGFYALLSCDQGQQSWEFPDLGHGVFSYFLMRGLRGEAAGAQGVIEADGLYRYIYHQTLQYIEKANQQLRLVNQQKRSRGETELHSEYSLQTPKRIVEGVGELVLGLKSDHSIAWQSRYALVLDGLPGSQVIASLNDVLRTEGNFELEHWSAGAQFEIDVRDTIQTLLRQPSTPKGTTSHRVFLQEPATKLLYLRGWIEDLHEEESCLVLSNGMRIRRSWLRQELRRSKQTQQIIILDCPGANSLEDWVEELKLGSEHGQCLIAAASPSDEPELFAQVLLESMVAANPQIGLSVASWLAKLRSNSEGLGIGLHVWLSGTQGVIEILPGRIMSSFEEVPHLPEVAKPVVEIPSNALATEAILTPEQYRRLEAILTELIGPIAPTLLEQLAAESNTPQSLLEHVSDLLSPTQQATFKRRASLLLQRSIDEMTSSISPKHTSEGTDLPVSEEGAALPESASNLPQASLSSTLDLPLPPEQFTALEAILLEIAGPIAPMLLHQVSESLPSARSLIAALSDLLPSNQRIKFEQRVKALLQTSHWVDYPSHLSQAQTRSGSSAPWQEAGLNSRSLNETFIQQCEHNLTMLVGPIAHFMVVSTLESKPQLSAIELVEALAAELPNPRQAREFRDLVLGQGRF